MHIARHPVPLDKARKLAEVVARAIQRALTRIANGDADEVTGLASNSESLAAAYIVAGESSEVDAALQLASRARGAMWALVKTSGGPIDVVLAGPPPVTLQTTIDRSFLHAGQWLECFWLATAIGDTATRDILVTTTVDFSKSQTQTHRYEEILVEALRAFANGGNAIAMVDSSLAVIPTDDPWQRKIDRPMIATARHIFARDAPRADAALQAAFEAHRSYWGTSELAGRDRGWISIPLMALVAISRDLGLTLTTTSDYAPR